MFTTGKSYNSVPASSEIDDDIELAEQEVLNPMNQNIEQEEVEPTAQAEEVTSNLRSKNLKLKEPCFNEIRILDLKGHICKLNTVPLTATIGDLKVIIEEETEVPIMLQRLIYGGKQLNENDQTLIQAKVKDNTVIHLFQRPPPKAPSTEPMAIATPINHNNANQVGAVVATSANDGGTGGMDSVHVPEFETYRRRVKLLACLLFFISFLNLVTIVLIILDATTQSIKTEEWISLLVELFVNVIGVMVAIYGIQGTNTLDQDKVQLYCFGLIVVGTLYIGIDVYRLARSIMSTSVHSNDSTDNGEDDDGFNNGDLDDGNGDKNSSNNDPVGAAAISLFFTLSVWSICFYRAFQFRYHLNLAFDNEATVTADLV